jgi:hypothetical protein
MMCNGSNEGDEIMSSSETEPGRGVRFAKAAAASAVCVLAAVYVLAAAPGFAQDARTGVSRPDPVVITANPDDADEGTVTAGPAKPSAAVPLSSNGTAALAQATDGRRPLAPGAERKDADDPDAGIVTYVPSRPGEVPDGTLLKAKLREGLSTLTTKPGSAFSAALTEPVMRDGRVVVPVGAVLDGRVTWVRGGKRLGGAAAIHLEPRTVTLPDGTQYALRARVIDTDRWDNTKVDSEGTILRKDRVKGTIATLGLATGGGAAAGAMIGGVPGALIGAGVGAGVSTVVWLKQDRQAELPKDLGLVFSLTQPMRVTPASAEAASANSGTRQANGGE